MGTQRTPKCGDRARNLYLPSWSARLSSQAVSGLGPVRIGGLATFEAMTKVGIRPELTPIRGSGAMLLSTRAPLGGNGRIARDADFCSSHQVPKRFVHRFLDAPHSQALQHAA